MSNFIAAVKNFVSDENGVTAIEYGLIAALIGIGVAATAGPLGVAVSDAFQSVTDTITEKL
jgi:pilus assembly protein Flp/PilA